MQQALYIAGPSAIGKTRLRCYLEQYNFNKVQSKVLQNDKIMSKLKTLKDAKWISQLDYENAYNDNDRNHQIARAIMLNGRTETKLYEHAHECLDIYPIVHELMGKITTNDVNREKLFAECFERCDRVLREKYSDHKIILILNTNQQYAVDYFNRLRMRNNNIDYNTYDYLYMQFAGYLAFLANAKNFKNLRLILISENINKLLNEQNEEETFDNVNANKLFGEVPDFGLMSRLQETFNLFRKNCINFEKYALCLPVYDLRKIADFTILYFLEE